MSENLKKSIENGIKNYLKSISIDSSLYEIVTQTIEIKAPMDFDDAESITNDISDFIEDEIMSKDLIESILKEIEKNIIEFKPTQSIDGSGDYICDSCYRPFGIWKMNNGNEINDIDLMKNGTNLILPE